MDRGCGHTGVGELLGDALGAALGPAEHDRRPHAVHDLCRGGDPLGAVDGPEVVGDVGELLFGDLELVQDGVVLVVADEHVDVAVERGGEEHGLAVVTALVEQLADLRQEAHVGHAVGLVEHDHVDVVEADQALVDQVGQSAGTRDGDVDAPLERLDVAGDGDAAEERRDPRALPSGELAELVGDLGGELTGRYEDQPTGSATFGGGAADDEGDAEGQGLAGPGRGLARYVAAGERVGQGQGLDGEGGVDAALGQRGDDWRGHAEVGEGGVHCHSCSGCCRVAVTAWAAGATTGIGRRAMGGCLRWFSPECSWRHDTCDWRTPTVPGGST